MKSLQKVKKTPAEKKATKPKRCSAVINGVRCQTRFIPRSTTQVVCSIACAQIKTSEAKIKKLRAEEKKNRAEYREAKVKMMTLGQWVALAQKWFNAFIRDRDEKQPCISCGTRLKSRQYHAGHYLARSIRPMLRFHPDNVHKQCARCNNMLKGNVANYRERLIARIGLERVLWLESPQEPARFRQADCEEIIAEAKRMLKISKL